MSLCHLFWMPVDGGASAAGVGHSGRRSHTRFFVFFCPSAVLAFVLIVKVDRLLPSSAFETDYVVRVYSRSNRIPLLVCNKSVLLPFPCRVAWFTGVPIPPGRGGYMYHILCDDTTGLQKGSGRLAGARGYAERSLRARAPALHENRRPQS